LDAVSHTSKSTPAKPPRKKLSQSDGDSSSSSTSKKKGSRTKKRGSRVSSKDAAATEATPPSSTDSSTTTNTSNPPLAHISPTYVSEADQTSTNAQEQHSIEQTEEQTSSSQQDRDQLEREPLEQQPEQGSELQQESSLPEQPQPDDNSTVVAGVDPTLAETQTDMETETVAELDHHSYPDDEWVIPPPVVCPDTLSESDPPTVEV